MAGPILGYSLTLRVLTPVSIIAASELAAAVGRAGGSSTDLDVTTKRNTIAVATGDPVVLVPDNIGPAAALPVLEGKAALFKQFVKDDAWSACPGTQNSEGLIVSG